VFVFLDLLSYLAVALLALPGIFSFLIDSMRNLGGGF
jgi:hypothetical protein